MLWQVGPTLNSYLVVLDSRELWIGKKAEREESQELWSHRMRILKKRASATPSYTVKVTANKVI